jgi:uncharacterized membrane protein
MAKEKRFTRAPDVPHTKTDPISVIAGIVGALSALCFFVPGTPVIYVALVLAVSALILGLRSRKRLQRDPALGGAALSAFGFFLGVIVLLVRLPVAIVDIAALLGVL